MYGKVIQKIRKSKNITLKEAAGTSLSVSQLSRFENEKTMIPVDRFFEILQNLNTTIEEFDYIQGNKNEEIEEIMRRIEKYNNNEEFEQLKSLMSEIKKTSPPPYSWKQFLIYFIKSLLDIYEEREPAAKEVIIDYLIQVENWGEMELRLYAIFGFILDIDTTYFLMKTALKRSKQYLAIPSAMGLLFSILSNNFSTFLAYDRIDYAEETIELFEKNYAENADRIIPHVDFIFNKGLLAFRKGDLKKAQAHCENAIEICQYFKQKEAAKRYTARYEKWKKNHKNPDFKEVTIQFGWFGLDDE